MRVRCAERLQVVAGRWRAVSARPRSPRSRMPRTTGAHEGSPPCRSTSHGDQVVGRLAHGRPASAAHALRPFLPGPGGPLAIAAARPISALLALRRREYGHRVGGVERGESAPDRAGGARAACPFDRPARTQSSSGSHGFAAPTSIHSLTSSPGSCAVSRPLNHSSRTRSAESRVRPDAAARPRLPRWRDRWRTRSERRSGRRGESAGSPRETAGPGRRRRAPRRRSRSCPPRNGSRHSWRSG